MHIAKGAHTECTLRNDRRLIAGVGAVVSHAAGRAGLAERDQTEFAAATEEACLETLATLSRIGHGEQKVQLEVADFPGRVEVTIEPVPAGRGPRVLQGRAAAHAVEGVCKTLERKGVDRVLCENLPRSFRMKLIKYRAAPKTAAGD
jgi:ribosomal protein S5